MSRGNVRWLQDEIPKLVNQGILSPEAASRLRDHYRSIEAGSRRNLAVLFFSILGTLLVGGGIILLLAHNWDSLSRPARVAISFIPLLGMQLLGVWVILRRRAVAAWRESVGIGLTLAVSLSIALISQTYNVPGDLGDFLLTCILLSIPVVYLLNAATPVVLLLAAISAWAGESGASGTAVIGFWTLMACLLPYFLMMKRTHAHPTWKGLLGWSFALALIVGSAFTMHDVVPYGLIPVFGALSATLVILGGSEPLQGQAWSRSFRTVGSLGAVGLSLVLTFPDLWVDLRPKAWPATQSAVEILALAMTGAVVLCAPTLLVMFRRRMTRKTLALAGVSVVSLAAWLTIWIGSPDMVSPLAFNLYLFGLGLLFLVEGVSGGSLSGANSGMAILTLLIAVRFFDPSISFVIRGLLFIAIGAGFLVTNLYLVRSRKRVVA